MPSRLPVQDICAGLLTSVGTAIRYWFHYTLVAFAWLGVVPLTACKCGAGAGDLPLHRGTAGRTVDVKNQEPHACMRAQLHQLCTLTRVCPGLDATQ